MITFNDIINNKIEIINNLSTVNNWMLGIISVLCIASLYYALKKRSYFLLWAVVIISFSFFIVDFFFVTPIKQDSLSKIAYVNIIKDQCSIVSVNRANRYVNIKGVPFFNNEVMSINIDCGGKKQTVEI